jgi:acetolactate synthase-1/2/3 large subunit
VAKSRRNPLNRRGFLKGAAAGAAALVSTSTITPAQETSQARPAVPVPSASAVAAEVDDVPLSSQVIADGRPGADLMVDVIQSLGFEYVCSNPGSSFRAFHESVINYGGNKPEWLTCLHEEQSVAIADGFTQVEGKPLLVAAHGTVGIQHASMAIYNSFCARLPIYIIAGNHLDATHRRPGVEWQHSVQDASAMVRDYIKWDDTPISLPHFAESAVRAYKIMMTPPMAPVIIVADGSLQEEPVARDYSLRLPKLTIPSPPQGESAAVAEVARLLVQAENPVLVAGRARSQKGMDLLVQLAETLQAPVQGGMPTRHNLSGGASIANADVIVGLDVNDLWGTVNTMQDQLHRTVRPLMKSGARLISIGLLDLYTRSNYQDFQRYPEVDIAIAADVEATLPALIEACRRLITPDRRRVMDERGKTLAANKERAVQRARTEATSGWDASPISTARLHAEVWEVIRNKDWASAGGGHQLWNVDKQYRTISASGGGTGLGHGAPASVGAALAHRKYGRFVVRIQPDGDFLYAPGALWTAAHHRIPMLFVMHNNRAYHQEVMHIQRMANRNQRGVTVNNTHIGTKIEDPNIDFALIARGMGLYAEGPVTSPSDLGPALKRAAERVERGETALVDVVTQPR